MGNLSFFICLYLCECVCVEQNSSCGCRVTNMAANSQYGSSFFNAQLTQLLRDCNSFF